MKYFNTFELFESLEPKLKKIDTGDNTYFRFNIMLGKVKIGTLNYFINSNRVVIFDLMLIKEEYRAMGYGQKVFKMLFEMFNDKGYTRFKTEVLSQESFFMLVKAVGRLPDIFGPDYKDFQTIEEVKEYLPLKSSFEEDGTINSKHGITVIYDLN